MSYLEYIERKVLDDDYFQVSGTINATNTCIEYVPPTGKIAFLLEAKVVNATQFHAGNFHNEVTANLEIGGVEKDRTKVGAAGQMNKDPEAGIGGNTNDGFSADGRFNVLGLSLVGTGKTPISIKNIVNNGDCFATMSGYLTDG